MGITGAPLNLKASFHFIQKRGQNIDVVLLLLKDFPHQALEAVSSLGSDDWIGRGIKLERTDIVGIEGNDEGCRPPQPTRESGERREINQWGPGPSSRRKRIWFILSVAERVQRMYNAVFYSN